MYSEMLKKMGTKGCSSVAQNDAENVLDVENNMDNFLKMKQSLEVLMLIKEDNENSDYSNNSIPGPYMCVPTIRIFYQSFPDCFDKKIQYLSDILDFIVIFEIYAVT